MTGEARVTAEVTGVSLLSKSLPEPRPWVDDRKDRRDEICLPLRKWVLLALFAMGPVQFS